MNDTIAIVVGVCGVIVSFLGVTIAFAVFIANNKKDAGRQQEQNGQISTKLDFVTNDLKEIKANHRRNEEDMRETREIALKAYESASSAHKRLDRAGIDTHCS